MTSAIGIGVVGLGFMAATHLKACRHLPQARIAALCSPSGRRLDGDFSDICGNVGGQAPLRLDMTGVLATRDVDELLRDPSVQVVDICSPTEQHAAAVLAALEAGKHVLCEKPLARSAAEARTLLAVARAANRFLMPAMCMRFWPGWVWLKDAIATTRYGRVLAARFRRVAEPPGWGQQHFLNGAKSGGALLDLHIHDVDFICHCFGKPRRVYAAGYSHVSGAIDHVVAHYAFDDGPAVHAEGAWTMTKGFGFHMAYTVNFERATADYDLARGADALRLFEPGAQPQTVPCPGEDGYVEELRHLLDAVTRGTPPSVVTAEDAVLALEVCEAEERSIRDRQPIALS
jgi:predicted dehydrogenase